MVVVVGTGSVVQVVSGSGTGTGSVVQVVSGSGTGSGYW